MELSGTPFLLLTIVLAVAAPVGALLLWGRVRGADPLRLAQRLGLLVLCQLTAVLLASVALNHEFVFYESWSDLFGQDDTGAVVQGDQGTGGNGGGTQGAQGSRGAAAQAVPIPGLPQVGGDQRVTKQKVRGPRSGVKAEVTYLVPPGYDDPANGGKRYPVVVFLPGYPGSPSTWLNKLGLQDAMDAEISAGRVQPFVAVLPEMNIAGTRDLECSDAAGGPAAGTWLGVDVPDIVRSQVRALPPGKDWGVTGYSAGGFCSAKLALQYPQTFGSAAVLSGYFTPSVDPGPDGLFGGDQQLLHRNDPMWLVTHTTPPAVRMLLFYTLQDADALEPSKAFAAAARKPLTVSTLVRSQGGHNTGVWQSVLPDVLRWLGKNV